MTNKKANNSIGVNIGTSSLLLVFVILCLVSFATLSMVSANANNKLNTKVIEKNTAYYNACNEAEEKLSGIDQTLKSLYESGVSRDEYFTTVGEHIDFAIPVTDVQTLNVSVAVNFPATAGDTFYSIEKWNLETTGSLDSGDSDTLHLLF